MANREIVPDWFYRRRRIVLAAIDALLVALGLALAYFIRSLAVESWELDFQRQFVMLLPFVVVVQVALFFAFNLYRGLLRYAGVAEVKALVGAVTVTVAAMWVFNLFHTRIESLGPMWPRWPEVGHIRLIPYSVIVIYWMVTILLVGGFRFSRRLVLSTFRRRDGKNVIIVGIRAGEPAARVMLDNPQDGYDPVGFVDPNPMHAGRRIHGLRVLGTLVDLPRLIRENAVEEVVIALPEAGGREISEIADIARQQNAEAKILPTVSKIMSGQISVSAIRPVTIEDILGRDPVRLELSPEMNYVKGKCVLVTGAGGSIGREIVSQLLKLGPERVVLLGRGESSLFDVAARLNVSYGDARFPLVVADIQDRAKMRKVFERHRPNVVFHTAAHKHVPFMEINPEEAIKNNVFGAKAVAELSMEFGVERFIQISTDKAVRPTSVMGASKRLAEMIMWDMAGKSATRFMAVRFGNVLGSRGSVVPTLKRQIARGGPVTITHRDMTRFFMTIPEAASLVIQSGALAETHGGGNGEADGANESGAAGEEAGGASEAEAEAGEKGRLFLLDMGQPVKIIELIHNLITLSGLRPGEDIEIKEIGPRPGEKIEEELLTAGESVKTTQFGKIFVTEPETFDREAFHAALDRLEAAAEEADGETIRAILKEIIPDYRPRD